MTVDHGPGVVGPSPDEDVDVVEVCLEDASGKSWVSSIAYTLASQFGNAYDRFVALSSEVDPDTGKPAIRVEGETFPAVRGLGPNSAPEPAWAPEMETALRRLQDELTRDGWVPAGHGEHAWSFRYTRPR